VHAQSLGHQHRADRPACPAKHDTTHGDSRDVRPSRSGSPLNPELAILPNIRSRIAPLLLNHVTRISIANDPIRVNQPDGETHDRLSLRNRSSSCNKLVMSLAF
jgi:hypothetical protein